MHCFEPDSSQTEGKNSMNTKLLGLFAAAALIGLAGCNKAEAPADAAFSYTNAASL